jgi:site-specific recombinase XerD
LCQPRGKPITQSLEPIVPEEAVDQYLKSRGQDASESTIQNHRYRLKHFLKWCEHASIENLNELSGRDCENYKNWRIAQGDVADITLEQQLRTFRVFLRYCESIEAIETGISEKLIIPKVSKGEAVRDDAITHEEACAIREHLRKYEYASKEHVIFTLLYHTGMRRGACVSLDVADWHSEDEYIEVQHRPDASVSTPLKLQQEGERNLSILDAGLSEAMDDYLSHNRIPQTEPDGREPLFTTSNGRISGNAVQSIVYRVTRPCYYGKECPHDRDVETCEATESNHYSACPSSVSPHPIRRSAIHHHLNSDVSKSIASERMAVSVDTLEEHYDARSREQKRQARQSELTNL